MGRLDWIETLLTTGIEEHLKTLSLTNGYNKTYSGSGVVNWSPGEGGRLRAFTKGDLSSFMSNWINRGKPGQLIPREEFHTLHGVTVDDWRIHAGSILQASIFSEGTVIWDTSIPEFELTDQSEREAKGGGIALLQHTSELEWFRPSEIADQNPHFGARRSINDWLELNLTGCGIAVRRRDETTAIMRIFSHDTKWHSFREILDALNLAGSFISGQKLGVIGYDYRDTKGRHLGCCPQVLPKKNRIAPPLGRGNGPLIPNYEQLIELAAEFFLTALGREVANHLHQCWSSLDNTITIQALVVCTSIEGIFKKIAESDKQISVAKTLDALSEKRLLTVGEDEPRAWRQIRHHVAHGNLLWHSDTAMEKQDILDNLGKLKNLLNVLVLQCIEYRGKFFDYGRHELRDFIPSEINSIKSCVS